MIYLDYNGTTPHAPEVIAAMRPYLEDHFGNPSSSHGFGRVAREAVERARAQVAGLINARTAEILFTSGGTESNNQVLRALAQPGTHVITSAIEHPAILEPLARLERKGGVRVTRLPVDRYGRVNPEDAAAAITKQTVLVSIMHANNEVGTVEPIAAIAEVTRAKGVLLHTDAAQSIGKIPVDVDALGVDLLTVAGHKLYAPKGIGALYIRAGVALEKFMEGAGQEQGRRAGTENVVMIAGLGAACQLLAGRHEFHLRDRLEDALRARVPGLRINGHPEERLPNTASVSFPGQEANQLLARLDGKVAASAGAACHSGETKLSHVLRALGVSEGEGRGTVRFSTGRFTTADDIDQAVGHILEAL